MVAAARVQKIAGDFYSVKHKGLLTYIGPKEKADAYAAGTFSPTIETLFEEAVEDTSEPQVVQQLENDYADDIDD